MTTIGLILRYQFNRPEIEILLDLIYIHNRSYKLQPHQVTFDGFIPLEIDIRPDILDDENTFLRAVVDRNVDHRLDPSNTGFLYRRLPLAALKNSSGFQIVPPPLPFRTYDILDQINQQLGSQLTENDLENLEYTTLEEILTIRAKKTSKVWIGFRDIDVEGAGPKRKFFELIMLDGFFAWTGAVDENFVSNRLQGFAAQPAASN